MKEQAKPKHVGLEFTYEPLPFIIIHDIHIEYQQFCWAFFIRDAGSYVTHETNYFVYFYIDSKAVLLFKSGWLAQPMQSTLHAYIALMYAPVYSESSAAMLEAGNLMILCVDVSAMDYSTYASSVRSDCIYLCLIYLGVVRILSCCNMIAVPSDELSLIVCDCFSRSLLAHAQYSWFLLWLLVGSRGPCVGHLLICMGCIYLNCWYGCLWSRY